MVNNAKQDSFDQIFNKELDLEIGKRHPLSDTGYD